MHTLFKSLSTCYHDISLMYFKQFTKPVYPHLIFKKCYVVDIGKNSHNSSNLSKQKQSKDFLYFHPSCSSETINDITKSFIVKTNFVSDKEESNLLEEVEPHLIRHKYQFDHWDNAIHGYRETERHKWKPETSIVIKRLKESVFVKGDSMPQIHVLDLAPHGVINPHVDAVRFCGNIVSGICLSSSAVMRLVKEKDKTQIIDCFLPQRALYIMKDEARYDFTHEILAQEKSYFGKQFISRKRRISLICRNEVS